MSYVHVNITHVFTVIYAAINSLEGFGFAVFSWRPAPYCALLFQLWEVSESL